MNKKIFTILLVFIALIIGIINHLTKNYYDNSDKKVEESRYNNMSPSDYHKEMKSDNMKYSDVAWHAQKTYGWDCEEITDMGNPIKTSGKELKDPYLISQLEGNYSVATCTSGKKLRVYPRKDTYPIITNINGGFD